MSAQYKYRPQPRYRESSKGVLSEAGFTSDPTGHVYKKRNMTVSIGSGDDFIFTIDTNTGRTTVPGTGRDELAKILLRAGCRVTVIPVVNEWITDPQDWQFVSLPEGVPTPEEMADIIKFVGTFQHKMLTNWGFKVEEVKDGVVVYRHQDDQDDSGRIFAEGNGKFSCNWTSGQGLDLAQMLQVDWEIRGPHHG